MASSRSRTFAGTNALSNAHQQTIQGDRGSSPRGDGNNWSGFNWSEPNMVAFHSNPHSHQAAVDLVETPQSFNPDSLILDKADLETLLDHNSSEWPSVNPEQLKRMKKRLTDKKYRDQRKKQKMTMEHELETLRTENTILKSENDDLKKSDMEMKEKLFCQGENMKKLKEEFDKLKFKYERQDSIVQALSQHVSDDLQLETQKLREENALLKQNVNPNDQSSEIAEMQLKMKVLQVQVSALCGLIINEKQKNIP